MLARRRRASRAGHGCGWNLVFGDDVWRGYVASPWDGKPVHDRFRFQRGQPRHLGDRASEQGAHNRSRKATSSHFFGSMIVPGQSYVHAARRELDEVTGLVEEGVIFIEASHVGSDNAGEITGPFRRGEVVVVTRGNDVNALKIGLVDPLLVLEDMFRQAAAETAIQNMIAAVDRLPNSLADHDS